MQKCAFRIAHQVRLVCSCKPNIWKGPMRMVLERTPVRRTLVDVGWELIRGLGPLKLESTCR